MLRVSKVVTADHEFFLRLTYAQHARKHGTCYSELDELINNRARLAQTMRDNSENGRLKVMVTGRDCDGYTYQHGPYEIEARLSSWYTFWENKARSADGPFGVHIVPFDYVNDED